MEDGQLQFFPRTTGGQRVLIALLDKHDNKVDQALTDACERLAAYEPLVSSGYHRGALTTFDALPKPPEEEER